MNWRSIWEVCGLFLIFLLLVTNLRRCESRTLNLPGGEVGRTSSNSSSTYVRVKIEREGEQYGTYYQAVRSYREQGKAKQEVFHLGEHQTAEEAPSSQTDEDLARTPLKPLPQLHGIIEEASKTNRGTVCTFTSRPSKTFTCSAATSLASWEGRTRSTSTGAVQLSRTKLSCAMNW
jgi:hypothetical protein